MVRIGTDTDTCESCDTVSARFGPYHIVSVSDGASALGRDLVVYSGFCRKGDAISKRYSRSFVFSVADCWSVVVSRPNLGAIVCG